MGTKTKEQFGVNDGNAAVIEEGFYSYHFQCWNCLSLHEGITQSDNQLLEITCNEKITWNNEVCAPDIFYLLGSPRTCDTVNHVYGRKIKPPKVKGKGKRR